MEIINKQTEKIEKVGKPIVFGIKSCKTYRKALQTLIGQQYKRGNKELEVYTIGLLNLYNNFHPEIIETSEIKGWKGKSSIDIEKLPDKVIITRFQKPSRNEESKEIRIEITKEQIETAIKVISKLDKGEPIKTRHIALAYSSALNLGHYSWKDFFSDRQSHVILTNILGYLDSEGVVTYRGGKTILLKKLSLSN